MPKYIDKQNLEYIEYTNFSKPSIKLTNGQVIGGNYKFNNDDTEFIPGSPIINAIDINWGSAILQLETGTTSIYTTSHLLNYIQHLNKSIVNYSKKIKGIKIDDKTYYLNDDGYIEVNDIISNIIISATAIENVGNLTPDESGILNLNPIITPLNEKIDDINDRVNNLNTIIESIENSTTNITGDDIENVKDDIIRIIATSIQADWNETAATSPAYIKNKPFTNSETFKDSIKNQVINEIRLPSIGTDFIIDVVTSDINNNGSIFDAINEKFESGKDGKSAYDIYYDITTASGIVPVGTVEWLNSLIGATGATGATGAPGNSISIKTEETCSVPGDSYISTDNSGNVYLNVYQGNDSNDQPIWQQCDLNIVVTPGSPPKVNDEGNWEWWDSAQNKYVSTATTQTGEPITFTAIGATGATGLDVYNFASSIYYSNNINNPNIEAFPAAIPWYINKLIPHINSNGFWTINTSPFSIGDSYEVLHYTDDQNNEIQAYALGTKGDPGKSPKIVATTLEGDVTVSNIWYVWDDTVQNYVPATTNTGAYIIAEGISGKDGRDLKLNLIPFETLSQNGYIIYDENEHTYEFGDKVTSSSSDAYFAVNITATPPDADLANWIKYNSPGVYYIYKDQDGNNPKWEYVSPIQGNDGAPGKSAYEIAIDTAIEQYNNDHVGQTISWQDVINNPGNFPEFEYLLSESDWLESLKATTISNDTKDEIINNIKNDLDYIASVTINNKLVTPDINHTASIDIYGEDIYIASTNASTIYEYITSIEDQLGDIAAPNDGKLTIEINAASNIVFSADTASSVTLNLPNVINENIINNATIIYLATSVASINQAIGFKPEDFNTINTLKNVIDELQTPGTGIINSVLDSIGNKVEKIDLIIPSSDFTTPATLSINKSNSTADLSDKIVTGISVNGSTLSPATGLITIGSVVTNIKYTTKDANNEDQIISITNTDGNISLDNFATTIASTIVKEIESNYIAATADYVQSIKVYTGATATADIVPATGNVVLNLNDYAKMMKLIIKNYTSTTIDAQDGTVYTTGTATLNIGGSADAELDLSAYATKEDIYIITSTLADNYYDKTHIDNSMTWDVITQE